MQLSVLEDQHKQDSLKASDWLVLQAVVKLPFANVKRLAAAAQQADPDEQELSMKDEVCNALNFFINVVNGSMRQAELCMQSVLISHTHIQSCVCHHRLSMPLTLPASFGHALNNLTMEMSASKLQPDWKGVSNASLSQYTWAPCIPRSPRFAA